MRTGPGNAEGENQQGAFIRRGGLDVRDRTSWSMGEASGPEKGEVSRETHCAARLRALQDRWVRSSEE